MPKLMLATTNPGKVREFRSLLEQSEWAQRLELLTPADWPELLPDVDETGATFAENARLKATALAAATGLMALADDSGLCVEALDSRPGLHSARWAGVGASDADRNAKLLLELAGVPKERRAARYICVVSLASPDGTSIEAEGTCDGVIAEAASGWGGFGYDPLFWMPEFGRTVAEVTTAEKSQISHRARALTALLALPDAKRRLSV